MIRADDSALALEEIHPAVGALLDDFGKLLRERLTFHERAEVMDESGQENLVAQGGIR